MGKDGNPASKPELIASVGMIDDFWIRDDESILFTTHGEALKSVSIGGEMYFSKKDPVEVLLVTIK